MRLPDPIRRPLLEYFRPLAPIAIYLFGSYGTARQHPASDLDLAILPADPLDPVHRFHLSNQLSTLLGHDVDLVDLSTASTVMAKEVIRTGERLITNNLPAVQDFEMRTLSDYARLNEERAIILAP
jgi:uncharacterized protein